MGLTAQQLHGIRHEGRAARKAGYPSDANPYLLAPGVPTPQEWRAMVSMWDVGFTDEELDAIIPSGTPPASNPNRTP